MRMKKQHIWMLLLLMGSLLVSCSKDKDNRIIVAADGSGDYTTIQEAINAVSSTDETTEIFIKNGVYKEKIVVPADKRNIHFLGEDASKTIIIWDDYSGKGDIDTFTSYTLQVLGSDILFEKRQISKYFEFAAEKVNFFK